MTPSEDRGPDAAAASIALLAARCAAVPAALEAALAVDLSRCAALPLPLWITGIGASEGPARLLALLCAGRGLPAIFLPLSCFVAGPPPGLGAGTLVVFSQGLSPNARLALAARAVCQRLVLITAVAEAVAGVVALRHPPACEDGLLLRVQGPSASALLALRLALALPGPVPLRAADGSLIDAAALARIPAAAARAVQAEDVDPLPAGALHQRLAFISSGGYGELCHGLRWKLLEGLWRDEPPAWDILQVVHGPFQHFYDKAMTLLLLQRPEEDGQDLYRRLRQTLVLGRHTAVSLRASLPSPLSFFEHDALCNGLLLRALRERPRDLTCWPGRGCDGPIYDLGLKDRG